MTPSSPLLLHSPKVHIYGIVTLTPSAGSKRGTTSSSSSAAVVPRDSSQGASPLDRLGLSLYIYICACVYYLYIIMYSIKYNIYIYMYIYRSRTNPLTKVVIGSCDLLECWPFLAWLGVGVFFVVVLFDSIRSLASLSPLYEGPKKHMCDAMQW